MLTEGKDFFADGELSRKQQIPILVVFSAPNCPYCDLLRREVLDPMSELAEYQNKVILRHISYASLDEVKDFTGAHVNHSKFNFRYGVNFYPTLMLMDNYGTVLAKKVGVTLIETYWTELDGLIEKSTNKLKRWLKASL